MKILVVFVEPMLYGMDLIHEVYERTGHQFQYIYCTNKLTGRDDITLPVNSYVCSGNNWERKKQVVDIFKSFAPEFVIINGYVGTEQVVSIRWCQQHKIPYAIETDTPLHIPENKVKAVAKKCFLRTLLKNELCYGFPGGTVQKDNLVYYGISEEKNIIMPMSVSESRIRKVYENLPKKEEIKKSYGLTDKFVFLFVGRLDPVKNVNLLIQAYKKLKEDYKKSALVIVGDGSETEILKKMAEKIEDIFFMGYQVFPKLVDFYKMSDAFVLPSNYEPWGLVVNEAMITGLPVIVSDVVGCRIDLVNENTGCCFRNNDVNSLYNGLLKIYNNHLIDYRLETRKKIQSWNYETYLKQFNEATNYVENKNN